MQDKAGRKLNDLRPAKAGSARLRRAPPEPTKILRADGHGAVDTGDNHAEQKEHFDLERKAGVAVNQSPDEASGGKPL